MYQSECRFTFAVVIVINMVTKYRVGQKSDHNSVTSEPKKNSLENAIVQLILKLPLYLAYVTTLPQLMPAKVAVNDKFQSMVATYLRFDGDVSNQIEKGLLLSL